jgi:biotin carboxylase
VNPQDHRMHLETAATRRLLLLTTTTGYQTRQFVEAAKGIGVSVVFGSDRCHRLDDPWQDGALPLKFEEPSEAARKIVEYARAQPIDGIVAVSDCTPPTAARACRQLGLPFHSPQAADACRNKYLSRRTLAEAGLRVPAFVRYPLASGPFALMNSGAPPVGFPCVLKPLALSASRGVIRADDPTEFVAAFKRIRALLRSPEVQILRQESSDFIQAEEYVEGAEFALEAIVERGQLKMLAFFDKPDALNGPYFAETIYVTPSRLDPVVQRRAAATLARAVEALGLYHGPLHAELRINSGGIWLLEVAARPIGGLCSRALRFRSPAHKGNVSLEELLIRLALGENIQGIERETAASGVMMIPVTEEGILEKIEGLEDARRVRGIEEIVLTARPAEKLVPWPEGSSYPGFIFARSDSPEGVERSLRKAHAHVRFVLTPALPVIPSRE